MKPINQLLRNCLSLNRVKILIVFLVLSFCSVAQIGNYIANGSFEERYNCDGPGYHVSLAKSWNSIDSSINTFAGVYQDTCNLRVPANASGFQYAHTGTAYIRSTLYCLLQNCGRGYMKNRLRNTLKSGTKYCVTFYISIANASPRGMDGFGIYFGDGAMDTIKYCTEPLTYITPQVKNPIGNVITDTLNWTAITGTFIANGTEKYALIGNFLADNAVTTASINTPSYPEYWTDVYVDDVSCVEVDLPAYAGPDKSVVPGDSVFIGRVPDFAIDSGCAWYQLPNTNTPVKNKTSGFWVKPAVTTTYIVKQILECSSEKWDTVVVYKDLVGLEKSKLLMDDLKIYPTPAQDFLELKISNPELVKDFKKFNIYNNLGMLIKEEEVHLENSKLIIKTEDLQNGVYSIQLKSDEPETVSKRFIINH